ncbi:AraC family transcriptional regulator [Planotetraspora silvatica]|uniref:AraC family transcriptional regulator n=1 Tax=Planotetraspora silvatica TaxID=234614 RepID=A0A8J3UJ19_9ACTN|nr:AraC family transcriptional regulator [Planotetraspora silvatica]GII46648.1 AraC family transcriptional regulator [Planotetraspora silvatica]
MLESNVSLDELRSLITRHAGRSGPAVGGLLLSAADKPSPPTATVAEPTLAVVAQGAKRLTLGDRIYDYGAGQYLVVSVGLPVTGQLAQASPERPFLGCGLTLSPAVIASLILEAGPAAHTREPGRRSETPRGVAVSDAPDDLLDAMVRMVRLLGRPADAPVLAPMIEREIHWRLLTGEQGATVRQIGLADSRLSHVGRAIRWIRDHHAEAIRVDDLAGISGMSASAFHRHFRAVTAMTPIQYQKRIRLQEARLLLLSGSRDVAAVGFTVGYDSASQFSREYRRLFGVPPGQDAARLRQQAGDLSCTPSPV